MSHIRRRTALAALVALGLAACGQGKAAGSGGAVPDDMTMGSPTAKVTVVEYASVACPHCARFNNDVFPTIKKKYIDTGRVKWVAREQLTGEPSIAAAGFLTARCAGKDKYFFVTDAVYRAQEEMFRSGDVRGVLLRIAQSAGLSQQQFDTCINDEKGLNALQERVDKFSRENNVNSTPTFDVNGKRTTGEVTVPALSAAIDAALAGKK